MCNIILHFLALFTLTVYLHKCNLIWFSFLELEGSLPTSAVEFTYTLMKNIISEKKLYNL